eukprot:546507_1
MSYRKKSMLKVIVLGDSGVGKTSVMNRWVTAKFSTQYKATIGADFLTKELMIDDTLVTMQVWDTAGQERFATLGVAFYRGADAVILVYDVSDKTSFQHISEWKTDFLESGSPTQPNDFPFILFGNKSDLPPKRKQVYINQVQEWLKNNDDAPFFETSAKDNHNIEQGFKTVAELAVKYNQKIDGDHGFNYNE